MRWNGVLEMDLIFRVGGGSGVGGGLGEGMRGSSFADCNNSNEA